MDILNMVWNVTKFIMVIDVIFVILLIRLAIIEGRW